jgi:hypothetical protein
VLPLVSDQSLMGGIRSPEGGNPFNIDPKTVRVAPEQRQFRRGLKKPEEPKQQPTEQNHELTEYYKREQERHSGVLENPIRVQRPLPRTPGEQRGVPEPSQPIPEELRQLARRVLSKPPMSPQQLEGIKSEDYEEWARNHPYRVTNYASAMQQYEEAVEKLAQGMQTDRWTLEAMRRLVQEEREESNPAEK